MSSFPFSTNRVRSSISKNNEHEKWNYPSELDFYKSLLKKDKHVDEKEKAHIPSAVWTHNRICQLTWEQVVKWEAMLNNNCKQDPVLFRFYGNWEKRSIKSFFVEFFNKEKKYFDRHDWFVSKCDRVTHYIIDYYDVSTNIEKQEPNFSSRYCNKTKIYVDCRPAVNNLNALFRRLLYRLYHRVNLS